ncbi:MAG: trypsin-like peptidase domain-containing protein [Solobacterium sp.]|nr:trypsin-like peptidase domain-containing protein [Solobacterium sp.]
MSQWNEENRETYTYGNVSRDILPQTATRQTPKKSTLWKTLLTIGLSTVLGFGAGLGGATLVLKQNEAKKEDTVVIQQEIPIPSHVNVTPSTELSIKEIAQKAQSSVVEINIEATQTSYGFFGGTYISEAAGSGVILSEDGYIITNAHVVNGANKIQVKTSDGTTYDAELVGADTKSDIGVIKINATGLKPATLGDSSLIEVGDTAVVIGNPLGTLGGTVTNGIVSATNRTITINNEMMTLIQTNAAINSGNSGGGLFNGNGDLIGIVNAKDSGMMSNGSTIEGLGFAIPINDAISVAEQLIENGVVVDRPYIGVVLQTVMQGTNERQPGVYITEIVPGSGAESGGLQVNDRIIQIDDVEVQSYTDISAYLKGKAIGDTVAIKVIRNEQEVTCNITLTPVITSTTDRG